MAVETKCCSLGLVLLMLPCLVPAAVANWNRLGDAAEGNVLHFKPFGKQQGSVVVTRPQTGGSKPTSGRPPFCNDLDCPAFTVIKNESGYQLREYVASMWASANSVDIGYQQASYKNFMCLFDYIDGKNAKEEKINMTAPVLIRIIPGPGPACKDNFTMSFFMSPTVADPPEPTDKAVFFSQLPRMRVYVRSFPGYIMTEEEWIKEALELKEALKGKGEYEEDFYYTAGYNSPYQLFHRHNEIWFIAK